MNIALQPVKFMEYLLEEPDQAVLINGGDSITVNLPDLARFALHKLIISTERPTKSEIKKKKDLLQATTIIEYLMDNNLSRLAYAWKELQLKGKGWISRVNQANKVMEYVHPDVYYRWIEMMKENTVKKKTMSFGKSP